MATFPELLAALESSVPPERNRAAISLMDLADPRAMEPLIRAIENPANRGSRGSMIYALSAFDCKGRFLQLFNWALQGGYEASGESLSILREQRLHPNATEAKHCNGLLTVARETGEVDEELLIELHALLHANGG